MPHTRRITTRVKPYLVARTCIRPASRLSQCLHRARGTRPTRPTNKRGSEGLEDLPSQSPLTKFVQIRQPDARITALDEYAKPNLAGTGQSPGAMGEKSATDEPEKNTRRTTEIQFICGSDTSNSEGDRIPEAGVRLEAAVSASGVSFRSAS